MVKLPNNYRDFLWHFIALQGRGFLGVLSLSVLSAAAVALWPKVTGYMVDTLNQAHYGDHHKLHQALWLALLFWGGCEVLSRLRGLVFAIVMPQFEANIRMSTCDNIIHHSYHYFTYNLIGGVVNRISDLPRSSKLLIDILLNNISPTIVNIVVSSLLLLEMQWRLSMILTGWLLLYLGLCLYFGLRAADYSRKQNFALANLSGQIVDSVTNHLNVLLLGGHEYEMKHLNIVQHEEKQQHKASLLYIEKSKLALGAVSLCGISVLFYYTILLWQRVQISIGDVVIVITSTLNLMTWVVMMNDELSYLFREIGSCQTSVRMIQDPKALTTSPKADGLRVTEGEVKFANVSFRYSKRNEIFRNKSIVIRGGERIGLAGLSGSGKSTFASLILRLYPVDEGAILIDGQDISRVELSSLYRCVSLVPQNPILFHRSIMDNIAYGRPGATEEEVIEAAKKSSSHEFIMQMEHKYNTLVGERGSLLSGGQRQRIAVARAILQNAPIVIMDEATSSLDSITEQQLHKSIRTLMNGKTGIIIAHRLSTLMDVDRILVFDQGKIVEDGPHHRLIQDGGHYSLLWRMQQDGMLPTEL